MERIENAGRSYMFHLMWHFSFEVAEEVRDGKGFLSLKTCGLAAATRDDFIGTLLCGYTLLDYYAHRAHEGGKFDAKMGLKKTGTNSNEQAHSRYRGHGALNRGRPNSKKLTFVEAADRGALFMRVKRGAKSLLHFASNLTCSHLNHTSSLR